MKVPLYLRWMLGLSIAFLVTVVPVVRYRWVYRNFKRLREVTPGEFYRCGSMSAEGFSQAIQKYKIKTVINLMDEDPDPNLLRSYFWGGEVRERELCERLGARFVFLGLDLLPYSELSSKRPEAIDQYLKLLDDPKSYPVLLHCRAGLHRTGICTALYRMEYQKWDLARAMRELRENGFGEYNCWSDNDYITEYLLTYQAGLRRSGSKPHTTATKQGATAEQPVLHEGPAPASP